MTHLALSAIQARFTMSALRSAEDTDSDASDFSLEWQQTEVKPSLGVENDGLDALQEGAPTDSTLPIAAAPEDQRQTPPKGNVEEAFRTSPKDTRFVSNTGAQAVDSKAVAVAHPAEIGQSHPPIAGEGSVTSARPAARDDQPPSSALNMRAAPTVNHTTSGQSAPKFAQTETPSQPDIAPSGNARPGQLAPPLQGEPDLLQQEQSGRSITPWGVNAAEAQASITALRAFAEPGGKRPIPSKLSTVSAPSEPSEPQIKAMPSDPLSLQKLSSDFPQSFPKTGEKIDSKSRKSDQTSDLQFKISMANPSTASSTPTAIPAQAFLNASDMGRDTTTSADQVAMLPVSEAETRSASSLTASQSITPKPELPQAVVRQLAVVLPQVPDRPVEVLLNPEELGRVRMVMLGQDTQMVVQIHADKAETSELIRRHLDMLAQDFHDMGYSDISFSFAARHGHQEQPEKNATPNTTEVIEPNEDPPVSQLMFQPSGLDMRL